METSDDFIRIIKEKQRDKNESDSDYRLAQLLGITRSAMSKHRHGTVIAFDDLTAPRIAELTGFELPYVLACLHAERTRQPELRAAWEWMARIAASKVAGVALGVGVAALAHFEAFSQCILCQIDESETVVA